MKYLIITCAVFAAQMAYAKEPDEMARVLGTGQWGWSNGDNTCGKNPQTIQFSTDLKLMTFSWRKKHDPADYDILYFDKSSLTSIVRGEQRRTKSGDKVIWQLILLSDTAFCWRRTDWPKGKCTPALKRCAGDS